MGWIPVTVMTAALPAQPRLVSIDGMMPERARRGRRRCARARRFRYARGGGGDLDGTWKSKARALSHRLEDGARRLADRAALATLTTNLRRDG